MKNQLKNYLDSVFISAPSTKKNQELKEEILANLYDKYDSYISEGMNPAEAYRKTVAGIGDLSELFERLEQEPAAKKDSKSEEKSKVEEERIPLEDEGKLRERKNFRAALLSVAILFYIISVVPAIIWQDDWTAAIVLAFVAVATGIILCLPIFDAHTVPADTDKQEREKLSRDYTTATLMLAGAVTGYILSVCFAIIFEGVSEALGASFMFLIIALSTVVIVLRRSIFGESIDKIKCVDEDGEEKENPADKVHKEVSEKKKGMTRGDKIFSVISGIYWLLIIAVYFAASFITSRWEITWMIFVIAGLFCGIASGIYRLVARKGTVGPIISICLCSAFLFGVIPAGIAGYDGTAHIGFFNIELYDDTGYEYGNASFADAYGLKTLDIVWAEGDVSISVWDGEEITVREAKSKGGEAIEDKDDQLRYRYRNGELNIQEYSPKFVIFGSKGPSKDLEVLIPRSAVLSRLDVVAVSGDVSITELDHLKSLDIDIVSGAINAKSCKASTVNIDGVSGKADFEACIFNTVDVDTVSGDITLDAGNANSIDIDGVSAKLTVILPADNSGFELEMNSVSGSFNSDFDTARSEDKYFYGDRGLKIDVDTVSGDVRVVKKSLAEGN